MRPRAIELSCGIALQRNALGQWWCANASEFVGPLRNLIGTLAHEPLVCQHYFQRPGLECTYEMIGEIRARHGYNFLWNVFAPDTGAIVITDELDDYCCESRGWFVGGNDAGYLMHPVDQATRPHGAGHRHESALAALCVIEQRWNQRLGQAGDANFTQLDHLPPWSLHRRGALWVFEDSNGVPFMNIRIQRPHGQQCEETAWLVQTVLALANVVDLPGLPVRIPT